MNTDTKEQIKNRMLRKAAELWDIPVNEMNDSFDPLISLLITACASEIEKLSGEINDTQTHITERLIQLLTPDTIFDSKPAHGIAYAEGLDPIMTIDSEYSFYHKKKNIEERSETPAENIFFTPTKKTKLISAKVKHLIVGHKCYEFLEGKSKNLLQIVDKKNALKSSVLYIGIESDLTSIPLNDLSLFFEHLGVDQKELFYYHLKNAKWFIGDEELKTVEGYWDNEKNDYVNLDVIFGGNSSKTNAICSQINEYYKKYYITIKSEKELVETSSFPEIELLLSEEKLEIASGVRWIKVEFPTVIANTTLEKLFCSLNTFPILNRKTAHFSYQLKDYINIFPIVSENIFLDTKSISNIKGKQYTMLYDGIEESEKGTYFLRNFNVGKLDSRKAKEYTEHLLELLKSESAAFSFLNYDFLESQINTLNQTISLLENKISEISKESSHTNYIYIKPYTKAETILVDYWVTNGVKANKISFGAELDVYEGVDLKQKGSYIVTSVFGGQDKLSMEQRLSSYRRMALSRNRIITEEDIKALCYELYSDKISDIMIRKGITKDLSLSKGLIQCVEIVLTANDDSETSDYEWEYLKDNVLKILKKQSINVFPFKILVNKKNDFIL